MKNKLIPALGVLLAFCLAFTACDNGTTGGSQEFTAVTGISFSQWICIVGEDLTLSGLAMPSNATNKTIVWSGEGVTNGTLTAASAKKYTVTATVKNGVSETADYTRNFEIQAYAPGPSGNPFEGKKWSRSFDFLPSDVVITCTTSTEWVAITGGLPIMSGTYFPYGNCAEWKITYCAIDPSYEGDIIIAVLENDGDLFLSNFDDMTMNGTFAPVTP